MNEKGGAKGLQKIFKSTISKIVVILVVLLVILVFVFMKMATPPGADKSRTISKSINLPVKKAVTKSISRPVKKAVTKSISRPVTKPPASQKVILSVTQSEREQAGDKTGSLETEKPDQPIPSLPGTEAPEPPPVASMPEIESSAEMASIQEYSGLRKLKRINKYMAGKSFGLAIRADGPINKYKYFFLKSPPRLVIDLIGEWEKPVNLEIPIESDTIKKVRIWKHPDKLRLVNDLHHEHPMTPVFKVSPNGLLVTLSKDAN